MEKKMEQIMETRFAVGVYRDYLMQGLKKLPTSC